MSHALRIRRKDIFKTDEYNWVFKISKYIQRSFVKFCTRNGLRKPKHYKIDYIKLAIDLGQIPGDQNMIRRWSIDHIIPSSLFCLNDDRDVKRCWSSENLCWLPRCVNYEKSDQYPWNIKFITKRTFKQLNNTEREYLKKINNRYEYTVADEGVYDF